MIIQTVRIQKERGSDWKAGIRIESEKGIVLLDKEGKTLHDIYDSEYLPDISLDLTTSLIGIQLKLDNHLNKKTDE